ncbi:MAG: cation-translocating P-type ATPase [Gemmataceae bacterium]
MSVRSQEVQPWHARELPAVFEQLHATEHGLSETEAQARLGEFGPNKLPEQPPPTVWEILLRQFRSPLIYILAIAAVVAAAIGDFTDAGFIFAVLLINAVIGTYQEWRAEQSSQALRKLLQIHAAVQRDGEVREISAEEVVPGDIVWLESGNRVPADIRLLSAHGLEVDESLLTGESLPVTKDPRWQGAEATPMGDRLNLAYAGSIVTRGRAKGVVVATGAGTSVGQLALDVFGGASGQTPLLHRMEKFSNFIAVVVLVSASLIAVLGVLVVGYTPMEMFLFGVALAVSAIPEGLPVALTIVLTVATIRMARRGVIVRRLAAVEGLGSCTFIATDKTGTLTCNELTVQQIRLADGTTFQVTGQGFAPVGEVLHEDKAIEPGSHPALEALARAAVLCNEADLHQRDEHWVWRGDAVDIALLSMGHKLGWKREAMLELHPQVDEIPFEPEHRYAASFHQVEHEVKVYVKGAPERVLEMCTLSDDAEHRQRLEATATRMAEQGYRVLGLAEGTVTEPLIPNELPPEPRQLTFLGFVGMIDPLRAGVREAVRSCREAGVKVSMVTGDHKVTALAIARDLGLAHEENQVLTGAELLEKSPAEIGRLVDQVRVFARVAPNQKLQIVNAAREVGHFVAVTGDGVNDAPALRAANIGVAMGKSGTDVAREASELVITDDNFATIVNGVEEGRVAFDNIRKVIFLLVSTGAAEIVLLGLAILTGIHFLPLLPVQILWLNLVTNGIQHVGLAFEPNEGDVLQRPPRPPQEPIFNWLMIERIIVAALAMGLVAFFAFHWLLPDDPAEAEAQIESVRNSLLLLMVLFENFHIGNCRSETKSAFAISPLRNPILVVTVIGAFLVHLAAMYVPLGQKVLGTAPIDLEHWGILILLALTILPIMELHKLTWTWRQRREKG